MERELLLDALSSRTDGDDDGMTSIISACTSCADVHLAREDINELALALVAPLRAEDDGHWMYAYALTIS